MTSTDTTHGAFAEQLLTSCRGLFSTILLADAGSEGTWNARLDTLRKHSLLTVKMPSPIQPKPIEIDQDRLATDSLYRKRIGKKLAAPRPSPWTYVNLRVDRMRFLDDDAYRTEVCNYVAARWAEKLLTSDHVEQLVVLKLTRAQLLHCLDHLGLHQISSSNLQDVVMRQMAEELVDKNPRFLAIQADLKAACQKVREETMTAVRAETAKFRLERLQEIDAAKLQLDKRCAEALESIRERLAASSDGSAQELAASSEPVDPEVEWQQSLAEHARAYKEANKWSPGARLLVTLASVAVAGAITLFAEVDGVSLAELIFGGSSDSQPAD